MKKILLGSSAAAVVAAAALGTPYYLGGKAQQSLQEQHQILSDTFFLEIDQEKSNYRRGWFSSTETIVLRLRPNVLGNLGAQLPDNIRSALAKPLTIINHVKHTPFADGFTPVRAVVETEFRYDPEVQKTLARFFGEQTPVALRNVIALDGSGTMTVKVAPFDYEELSGIKLNWKGMDGTIRYQSGFSAYGTHFSIPAFAAQLADKGSLNLEQLDIATETAAASNNATSVGSSETKLGKLSIAWQQGIDYDIRINELVNMVTDLQIGAFINPTGTVMPGSISVENLHYATRTTEPNQGFINTEGTFAFAKLNYGDTQYGPLNIDIAAEHLHADSLNALKTRLQQMAAEPVPAAAQTASEPAAAQPENTDTAGNAAESAEQSRLLAAVRNEGAGLFTNNPVFQIRKFDFTTPTGHIKAAGSLKFNGLLAQDLNALAPMVAKMNAQLDLDISQNLIEDFAITQTRSLFTVNDPDNAQEQQEIGDVIRELVSRSIDNMSKDGYLDQENGAVKTRLTVADNRVELNGKPFKSQTDEDLFAGLEDENTAPAQPEAASAP